MHGLKALAATNRDEVEFVNKNFEVCHVGPEGFKNIRGDELTAYLQRIEDVTIKNILTR